MTRTRRWGIIGSIALAHLGVIVGYQAVLTGGPAPAYAQGANPAEVAVAAKENPVPAKKDDGATTTPAIPLPYLPPLPGETTQAVEAPPSLPALPEIADVKPQALAQPTAEPPLNALPLPGLPPATGQAPVILPVAAKEPAMQPQQPQILIQPVLPGGDAPGLPTVQPLPPTTPPPATPPPATPPPASPPGDNAPGSPAPAPAATVCPWNLTVEIVNGRTLLTAQNGKQVKFTISCEKLDIQTPKGRIEAAGKVQLSSDNLDGTCDRVTISWQEDAVVLERAQLKCRLEGQQADLNADQLRLRLSRVVPEEQQTLWR
jgi:hypothetical protein